MMSGETQPLRLTAGVGLAAGAVALYLLPFLWPVLWPTAWVALWPLIELARRSRPRRAALWGYVTGLALFLVGCYWIGHVSWAGWALLCGYLAAYVALFALAIAWISRRCPAPMTLAAPCLWVALEVVRGRLMSGFPWLELGHSQHACLPLIQIADLAGVHGVSFLLAMAAGAGSDVLAAIERRDRTRTRLGLAAVPLAATLIACACALGYGLWRLRTLDVKPGPRVAIVQGNIPQALKLSLTQEQALEALGRHVQLSRDTLAQEPDMIVWPETMSPGMLNLPAQGYGWHGQLAERCRAELGKLARDSGAHLLIGSIAVEGSPITTSFNSAFLFGPTRRYLGRYDKMHLVPFGEFIPFRKQFPFLARIVPVPGDMSPGKESSVFDAIGEPFGVLICYEDVVPYLARALRRDGAAFAVNITNDGWFRGSPELDQHNGIAVFRAVENRMGLVRATNTGMSSFISPTGRVHAVLKREGKWREVEGTLVDRVRVSPTRTLFTRVGDAWGWLCVAASAAMLAWAARGRSRKSQPDDPIDNDGKS